MKKNVIIHVLIAQVFENDMKPKQVCLSCVSKLDVCISFMDMSREADGKFETLLQNKTEPVSNVNGSLLNGRTLVNNQVSYNIDP